MTYLQTFKLTKTIVYEVAKLADGAKLWSPSHFQTSRDFSTTMPYYNLLSKSNKSSLNVRKHYSMWFKTCSKLLNFSVDIINWSFSFYQSEQGHNGSNRGSKTRTTNFILFHASLVIVENVNQDLQPFQWQLPRAKGPLGGRFG